MLSILCRRPLRSIWNSANFKLAGYHPLALNCTLSSRKYGTSPVTPDSEVVGPGTADPNAISTPYEISAGLERVELLAKLAGRSAFLMEPLKVDHYGTLSDPILVDSVVGRRLVGCTGFPKYSHDVLWFWVDGEEGPMRCQDCGQAFRINKLH